MVENEAPDCWTGNTPGLRTKMIFTKKSDGEKFNEI
jgi:hypothetical protein